VRKETKTKSGDTLAPTQKKEKALATFGVKRKAL